MYQVQDSTALLRVRRRFRVARTDGRPLVARTVVLLGLTSLVTDISSEMVAAVLPLYLVTVRGLNPLQFGVVDGIYQGGSAIVRIAFGFVADRMRRYRDVAAVGYALSAASKLGLLLAGSVWTTISGVVLADRIGKGIRTAPRDAMISLSSPPEALGTAFGVHRAMDTCGAMLGPLLAFGLLSISADNFHGIFLVSLCFAVIGVAILLLLVRDPARESTERAPAQPRLTLRGAGSVLATPRFGSLVAVATVLGLVTVSDAFVYLSLQRSLDFDPSLFPLLYVGTALVFMTLALPAGRLADRAGRLPVFLGGYVIQLGLYAILVTQPANATFLPLALVALGMRYAATDGVLAALGAAAVPERLRGTGLAVLGTATGLAQFGASVAFGALWTFAGPTEALVWFTAALGAALLLSGAALHRTQRAPA
jgi:MFS family permease